MRRIALLTTGGTIEKVYDEFTGKLVNRGSIVRRMLARLKLVDTEVHHRELMSKDSLEMTDEDRRSVVEAARAAAAAGEAVVILHGTDTLCQTGELLARELPDASLRVPVILTGAMRPFEMEQSDALQNLTEALFATSLLAPGVYVVAHGRAIKFPGVVKSYEEGTFVVQARNARSG